VDEVVVELLERELGASLDPPKRAEFHLAKRLLMEAEELLARGDYVQASEKAWAAAQIVNVAKKGKELKSAAARQQTAGEDRELRRPGAAPTSSTKTSTGWTPPGDVKYAVEDVEQFVERFKKLL